MVDFGFECIGAGRSERLDHVFISTYREQTHRIDKVGYSSEIWLCGMVLLISEPSARTSLTILLANHAYERLTINMFIRIFIHLIDSSLHIGSSKSVPGVQKS